VKQVKEEDWMGRFQPRVPVGIVAKMILHEIEGDRSMTSSDGTTMLL
jgi:hypothetical protein